MKPKRPLNGHDQSIGYLLSESDAVRLLADATKVARNPPAWLPTWLLVRFPFYG